MSYTFPLTPQHDGLARTHHPWDVASHLKGLMDDAKQLNGRYYSAEQNQPSAQPER
jgi:hypothetical protein